ncbi:hypothetical protein [Virgibacillus necropolis]|uniref:Uncharacterized protein n=1 Tax=Virgibacillus necropolis TaxID=163877 RepID=A0A221MGT7_9BACI|nr:hypothetical protein [Virgibacillus necropolis]ASN06851.1 hypothetical protein CFK40_18400 [Virgibacillus necropolis]
MEKILYHYTSTFHLPKIIKVGFLKLTESNLRMDKELYKPVVWLTTAYEPNPKGLGLTGSIVDKTEIRIHVKKKNSFQYWKSYSRKNKIDKKWAEILETGRKSNTWWVSTEIIALDDVQLIENKYTGEIYYSATN